MSERSIDFVAYIESLRRSESRLRRLRARYFPTSFDYANALAYPRSLSWRWTSAYDALSEFGSRGVMMRLPLASQLEVPLWDASREAGAFVYVSDRDNMPLASAALKTACIDTVVTDPRDAERFSEFLRESNALAPAHWLLVHDATAPIIFPELSGDVAHEVHLFPGAVILAQCSDQRKNASREFHTADGYQWSEDGSTLWSCEADPYPMPAVKSPVRIEARHECTCGRPSHSLAQSHL